MNCEHITWTAKIIYIADGRPSLREFCVSCGFSNGGSRLGIPIPMESDENLLINSHKYMGKTLGKIAFLDKAYLRWLVRFSKSSDRIKKSAARIYYNEPYFSPKNGDIYPKEKIYSSKRGAELVIKLQNETQSS